MEKVKRESGIELMRIICMIMIVMHHYSVHTAWGEVSTDNLFLVRVLRAGAPTAINSFLLITGYFNVIASTNVKGKVLRLCRTRWFYSILISLIMLLAGIESFNSSFFFRAVFPILTCRHNYVATFVMLYLFIPFLNRFIQAMSEKEFKHFILLMTTVVSGIPTFMTLTELWTDNVYSYLFWMMYIYCLGAFLRLNEKKIREKGKLCWGALSVFFIAFIIIMETIVEPKVAFLPPSFTSGTRYGLIPLVTSIVLFNFFIVIPLKYNKVINSLASSTFAVLLIHDDPMVRNVLWSNILKNASYSESSYLWLHALISVILIYLVCYIIDNIYVHCLQNVTNRVYVMCKNRIINKKK